MLEQFFVADIVVRLDELSLLQPALAELCLLWLAACEKKYARAHGTTSSTIHECRTIARALEPDGAMPAVSFKARALVAVQERLGSRGKPRLTVNRTITVIRRLFRRAASAAFPAGCRWGERNRLRHGARWMLGHDGVAAERHRRL